MKNYNYKLHFRNGFRYLGLPILLLFITSMGFAQFNGGTGTEMDPYQIANVTQLQAMNTALDKHYILTQNIDASETSTWNAGAGFEPIGITTATAFTGTFDGKGFVIYKLYINRPSGSGVGLFGNAFTFTPNIISIQNVGLDSVYVKGSTRVGALVGNKELAVLNCFSSGTVEGGGESVGGLIGRNGGLVDNCHSSCNVSGGNRTGGLVGTGSNIRNSYATGNVAGVGEVGGFIGGISSNASLVYNCYATGNVIATGNFPNAGGFIGRAQAGTIDLCYATGNVTGTKAAGFIYNANAGLIKRCYTSSTVTSTSNDFNMYLAGFIGENEAQIRDCYTLAKINYSISNSGAYISGFVGRNEDKGKIYNCYTSAKLNAGNATRSAFAHSNEKSNDNVDTGKIMFSYYNVDTTGSDPAVRTDQGGVVVVTSLTDVLMRKQNSFALWNFDTTWNINENISYPFLRKPGAPCVNTSATDSIRACKSYTWINGITYTVSVDTASFIIPNAAGCDSIITLKLTIDTINTDVSLNANILSATESAAGTTYQWINCDTNKPIANATNQTYTVTLTGNYGVIISNGACMDTSDCVTVTLVGFESNANHEWNVYPNPTSSKINFELKSTSQLTITDALGKIVLENNLHMGKHQIDLSEYANGVYILNLNDGANNYRNRVVLSK